MEILNPIGTGFIRPPNCQSITRGVGTDRDLSLPLHYKYPLFCDNDFEFIALYDELSN